MMNLTEMALAKRRCIAYADHYGAGGVGKQPPGIFGSPRLLSAKEIALPITALSLLILMAVHVERSGRLTPTLAASEMR
jgi:hypothetical protein